VAWTVEAKFGSVMPQKERPQRERTMVKEKFPENPKIRVTEKKSKFKKVKLSPPSRSGAKQDGKKA
jgi:hypothetical protein